MNGLVDWIVVCSFWGIGIALVIIVGAALRDWCFPVSRERRTVYELQDASHRAETGETEQRLLNACFGDQDLVERLIQYEVKRLPRLSRGAATQAALERLWADRRD